MDIFIVHLLLAVTEFFLINWLGKHSISSGYYQISFIQNIEESPLFNVIFRVFAPTTFLILTAVFWYAVDGDVIVENYWRVTALYFGIRWSYNLVMGRAMLLRWWNQIVIAAIAIAVSFAVSKQLLLDRSIVLPSARALTDELWIVVIGFLYFVFNRIEVNNNTVISDAQRKENYLRGKFAKYRDRYGSVIKQSTDSEPVEVLSYAVMIYESFNRPGIYQGIERYILFPLGIAKSLGPMQVPTNEMSDNNNLVKLGVKTLSVYFTSAFNEVKVDNPDAATVILRRDPEDGTESPPSDDITIDDVGFVDMYSYLQGEVIRKAAACYNARSDYPEQVVAIFDSILEWYYPHLRHGTRVL